MPDRFAVWRSKEEEEEKSKAIDCARSQRPLIVQGDAGHPSWQGGGPEKNNLKKWRAEEEKRHKGSPTPKKSSEGLIYLNVKHFRGLKSVTVYIHGKHRPMQTNFSVITKCPKLILSTLFVNENRIHHQYV
jgi:hypothetical protein